MLQFGVGRPAIREAMQALQQMGLLRISHGERARVINPTPEAIIDQISSAMIMMLATNPRGLANLTEARLMLETGLVRIATRNASLPQIDRLSELLRALKDARGDSTRFVAVDMAFHGMIAEMSGNQLIAAVTRAMLDWLSRFKRDMISVRGAERLTIEEHEKIYRAIAAGDPDAAATAMSEHIGRANTLYSRIAAGDLGAAMQMERALEL
jgi:DNA-binding FadR family transcriptional regulator